MNILSKITIATAALVAVVGLSACNSSETASVLPTDTTTDTSTDTTADTSTDTAMEPNSCLLEAQYITLNGLGLPGVTTFVLDIGAPLSEAGILAVQCDMTVSQTLNNEDEVTSVKVEGGGLLLVYNPNEEKLESIRVTPPGEVIVAFNSGETVSMATTLDEMSAYLDYFSQVADTSTYVLKTDEPTTTTLYLDFDAEGKVASIEVTTGFR